MKEETLATKPLNLKHCSEDHGKYCQLCGTEDGVLLRSVRNDVPFYGCKACNEKFDLDRSKARDDSTKLAQSQMIIGALLRKFGERMPGGWLVDLPAFDQDETLLNTKLLVSIHKDRAIVSMLEKP